LTFSIIIFSYNEANTLPKVIVDALSFLHHHAATSELVIVDDGSSDNTKEVCLAFKAKHPEVKLISHPKNLGIGQALKTGYSAAQYEYVCAIPGDGQFDVNELAIIRPFSYSTYYSFYRTITGYSLYRKTLSWLNRLFNQHFLGIYLRDVNWIKVYRKDQLDALNLSLTSSLIESEICAKLYKKGTTPIEIPSKYLQRTHGEPKGGSWHTLKKAIQDLIKLWWVVTTFKAK